MPFGMHYQRILTGEARKEIGRSDLGFLNDAGVYTAIVWGGTVKCKEINEHAKSWRRLLKAESQSGIGYKYSHRVTV
jgi:hypothetical protein